MDKLFKSRYNQITKMDKDHYAVFNPLSGAFDIADVDTVKAFESGVPRNDEENKYWLERGYYFANKASEKIYIAKRYQDFLEVSEENEIQFLLVPTYGCNFNCPYCYQKGIDTNKNIMSQEMLNAFVDYVVEFRDKNMKKVTITLFGGEPLLLSEKQKNLVSSLVDKVVENNISLAVVTNGYNLEEYVPMLNKAMIKEIHISLDGAEAEHNRRRNTKDGKDSYQKIMRGMEKAKDAGLPLNARLITDKQTLKTFPELAKDLEKRGFFDLPKGKFKTSLGRNYELIDESMTQDDLLSLDEMYKEYTDLMLINPILKKLHMPNFFGVKKMVDSGEMYVPSFDTCPAGKSEFVFDASGNIFGCTASCGREGYELGTYFPDLKFDELALKDWKTRNILNISECVDCSVGVVCGGGCGVIAKDRNGKVHSANCKPIKEVMDIGINYYRKEILDKVK